MTTPAMPWRCERELRDIMFNTGRLKGLASLAPYSSRTQRTKLSMEMTSPWGPRP
jgi:hypothetical protein